MTSSSRKRNLCQHCNDDEQEQDQDEYRSRNNPHNPGGHVNSCLGHVDQTSSNSGGGLVVAESSNAANHNHEVTPVLGLKLDIYDQRLIKEINLKLAQEKERNNHQEVLPQTQPESKASHVFAESLKIGSWTRASVNEGDLTMKVYYKKKKLMWEFVVGSLKKKIEIEWTQVSAIKAYLDEEKDRLEIELSKRPECYDEINFKPGVHTQWQKTDIDFTQGQAHSCRRHTIFFSSGILVEHFEKLIQSDNRLLHLSQQPFPYDNPKLFNTNMEVSYNSTLYRCPHVPLSIYDHQGTVVSSVQNFCQASTSFVGHPGFNLPIKPGVHFQNLDEIVKNVSYVNEKNNVVMEQRESNQIQNIPLPPIEQDDYLTVLESLEALIPDQQMELHDVDNEKLIEVTTEQNCFKADSTCKPFEQNHQNNSNPPGNEMNDKNHHVGPSGIDPGFGVTEETPSGSFSVRQFNDVLVTRLQKFDSFLSSQVNYMHGELPLQDSNSEVVPQIIGKAQEQHVLSSDQQPDTTNTNSENGNRKLS